LHNQLSIFVKTGDGIWLLKIEDTTGVPERCIRLSVRIARRSAKFPSNHAKTVRCTAGTVFPSTKIVVAAAKIARTPRYHCTAIEVAGKDNPALCGLNGYLCIR
jgi:hypothetical protein